LIGSAHEASGTKERGRAFSMRVTLLIKDEDNYIRKN
jgi:hypothetical protein